MALVLHPEVAADQFGQFGRETAAGQDKVAAGRPGGGQGLGIDVRAEGDEGGRSPSQLPIRQQCGGGDLDPGRQVDEDRPGVPLLDQ